MNVRPVHVVSALGAVGIGAAAVYAMRRRTSSSSSSPASGTGSGVLPVGYVESAPYTITQQDIIQAAQDGRLEFRWTELPGAPGVYVFEDAAKLGGIRVPVSARTTAAVAKTLGSQTGAIISPTTPLVEDMIYNQADVRVKPVAQDVANLSRSVAGFHASIERQIAQQTSGRPSWGLVSCIGKSWVLSNMALDHAGMAINYGFHWPIATATTDGGPWLSVDGRSKVFQQPGARHNPDHFDYSQTLRLCRLDAGAALPSHEPLKVSTLWV